MVKGCGYERTEENGVFFDDTATTEIYTSQFVGSVRCVYETDGGLRGCLGGSNSRVQSRALALPSLSLIHIPELTRLRRTLYAVFRLK